MPEEIRLRAIARIGQISRELEKAKFERDESGRPVSSHLPAGGKMETKEQQLAAAGISTSTANRYQQLAAPNAAGMTIRGGTYIVKPAFRSPGMQFRGARSYLAIAQCCTIKCQCPKHVR
jgi:hypothetical protein